MLVALIIFKIIPSIGVEDDDDEDDEEDELQIDVPLEFIMEMYPLSSS